MNKILESTKDLMKNDIPVFKSGDTLAVGVKVIEGEKSRIQMFEGVVIAISSGSGLAKTFTLKKFQMEWVLKSFPNALKLG